MKKKQIPRFELLLFLAVVSVFLLTFFLFKYSKYPDSPGYIKMHANREPLYPLFLAAFRTLFHKEHYFTAVSLFQNILYAVSIWFTAIRLQRLFHWNRVLTIISAVILAAPNYLTAAFASSGLIMSCAILTEGITIPMFYFFVSFLLTFLIEKEAPVKNILLSTLFSCLLAYTRGQMKVTFLLIFLAVFLYAIRKKSIRFFLLSLAQLAGSFLLVALLTRTYVFAVRGQFVGNVNGATTASTAVWYVSDPEDADRFEDEEMRALFSEIIEALDQKELNLKYHRGNLILEARTAEDLHLDVRSDTVVPILNQWLEDRGITNSLEKSREKDRLSKLFIKTLLPAHIGGWLEIWSGYFLLCLVRSVAVDRSVFFVIVPILYCIILVLAFMNRKKDKNSASARFAFFVLISILGFSAAIPMVAKPMSRYLIYNLPFFYLAGLSLLYERFWKKGSS